MISNTKEREECICQVPVVPAAVAAEAAAVSEEAPEGAVPAVVPEGAALWAEAPEAAHPWAADRWADGPDLWVVCPWEGTDSHLPLPQAADGLTADPWAAAAVCPQWWWQWRRSSV